jgi:hypothetical protein
MVGFGWATFGKCVQSTMKIPEKVENVIDELYNMP